MGGGAPRRAARSCCIARPRTLHAAIRGDLVPRGVAMHQDSRRDVVEAARAGFLQRGGESAHLPDDGLAHLVLRGDGDGAPLKAFRQAVGRRGRVRLAQHLDGVGAHFNASFGEKPELLRVHAVEQHEALDAMGMRAGEGRGEQPAEGVPGQHDGAVDSGGKQQGLEILIEVGERARPARGCAEAHPRAVIAAGPEALREQGLYERPVEVVSPEARFENDGGVAGADAVEV